jgi:hypothetical protein
MNFLCVKFGFEHRIPRMQSGEKHSSFSSTPKRVERLCSIAYGRSVEKDYIAVQSASRLRREGCRIPGFHPGLSGSDAFRHPAASVKLCTKPSRVQYKKLDASILRIGNCFLCKWNFLYKFAVSYVADNRKLIK